jgi:hypothetical protein
MAVAHDASSASHASGAFSVSQASFSWTHTPAGTPRGVLVLVFQGVSATNAVTSVTYGGTAMTHVGSARATDTTTEPGSADLYFLGSAVPTGAQTVQVNRTNNTTTVWAVCTTQTAATDTEVTGIVLTQSDGAIAQQSVDDGSPGVDSVRYAGVYYGGATPAPAGANSTLLHSNDAGAYGWTAVRETTAGQGARLVGCTQATSDDRAGVHLAVRELVVPAFTVTARQSGTNAATPAASLTSSSATPTADSLFLVAYGAEMDAFGTENLPVLSTPTGDALSFTLVDKDGDVTPGYLWGSSNGFWTAGGVWRAPIGASPSAFTVTVDGSDDAANALHSLICFDITGHDTANPIVQAAHNGARINPESSAAAGTVTLPAAPTASNLIVVVFIAGADSGGGFASPTAGAGKTFTAVGNNQSAGSVQVGAFTREADGSESTTITCSDLGDSVGNYVAVAFEVAAAGDGAITGSGALAAPAAQASGAGAVPVAGSGSVTAPAAVVAGTGSIGTPSITGDGSLTAPAAAVAGAGSVLVTGAGALAASPGVAAGVAVVLVTGSGTAVAPAAVVSGQESGYRYVTGISANGRYFTDQSGLPILVRGESPWAMFTDLSPSQMDTYLANRASYGCNLMLVSMIGSVTNGGPADTGATYDGVLPFTGGNPTVFNETYWSRMDSYIAKARDLGITLMIYPMDGWNTAFASVVFDPGSVSNAQCQTYGETLAERYLDYPNIIWAFGGDYNENSTINDRFNACLTGIRAAGDTRPASIQLLYETSESHNSSFWETKVDWDWVYTYYVTYKGVSDAYNYTWTQAPTVRPALFCEGAYENSNAPHPGTDLVIRRQAAWALTSGSPGELTGQEGVWNFLSGWEGDLDTTAADQLKAIRDTFEAIDWWTLIPDDGNQLVTAGRGTRITTDSATFPSGNTYVTAARAADGTLAVIYLPNAASAITVDMSRIGANPTATWVDPTTGGTVTATPGSSYSRGNNAAGSTDWLLILTGDPVTSTGSGTVVAPPATAAGAGTVQVTGIGQATAAAAATSGTGSVPAAGAGAATAPAAAATGTGGVVVQGSGSATAPASTVSGSGSIGATPVTGSGDLTAPAAQATGTASVIVTAAGAATAAPAAATGTGTTPITGAGQATAPAATAAGSGNLGDAPITATGTATAPAAAASGSGTVLVDGAGSLVTPTAIITGSGAVILTATGQAIAPAGQAQGTGAVVPEEGYVESVLTVTNSPAGHLSATSTASSTLEADHGL